MSLVWTSSGLCISKTGVVSSAIVKHLSSNDRLSLVWSLNETLGFLEGFTGNSSDALFPRCSFGGDMSVMLQNDVSFDKSETKRFVLHHCVPRAPVCEVVSHLFLLHITQCILPCFVIATMWYINWTDETVYNALCYMYQINRWIVKDVMKPGILGLLGHSVHVSVTCILYVCDLTP